MKMKVVLSVLAAAFIGMPTALFAGEATIAVKGVGGMGGWNPATLTVKAGDTLKLENKDVLPHGIVFEGLGITKDMPVGSTSTITVSQKGTFPFRCSVPCPGHEKMKGTLKVE